jgi:hypothetical protein
MRLAFLGQIVKFVGAGAADVEGGDACVAYGGRNEGDASVPSLPSYQPPPPLRDGSASLLVSNTPPHESPRTLHGLDGLIRGIVGLTLAVNPGGRAGPR